MEWMEGCSVKVSDWIASFLARRGVRHVFMVTGGGAMHLNHSIGTHPDIECVFNHHEQACAMAAEAYYRLNNRLAVVNVTSGPGGTNALTGVYGAFVDSVGMLVLSGQVKTETTVRSTGLPLRQYGDQELDIDQLVRPISKYSAMVLNPKTIRYHLEKAMYLATTGRPGPCWLDIPLDIQAAQVDPDSLIGFDPVKTDQPWKAANLEPTVQAILQKLAVAQRPVILAGGGVRLSGAHAEFITMVEKLGVPVVTAWNAHDVIVDDHPLYVGRPGTVGDRPGNFAVQNADFLMILGSRLNIRQVSYNWKTFARNAYKVWVEIDPVELKKPSVVPDMPVVADLADFLPTILTAEYAGPTDAHQEWLAWCHERRRRFPVVLDEYWHNQIVNPYCFMQTLFNELSEDQNVVTGNGSACVISFQVARIKSGQRLWTNSGCATMGYDLPAAIGICKASGDKPVVCLTGDGSIMMNLQELQTIVGYQLPIKIFILNNNGYVSISQTHRNFFNGVEVGGGPRSNVTFPDFSKIAEGFGFPFIRVRRHDDMAKAVRDTMGVRGPAICEVIIDENVAFAPKLSAKQHSDGRITSPALEDLSPFLSRKELQENMIVSLEE